MKNRFLRPLYFAVVVLTFSVVFTACKKKQEADKAVISVKGSDTMVNLAQKWAEEYMKANPGVSIQVTGGGSGTGIAALLNGTTDVATSSRELKEKEIKLAKEKNVGYETHKVALDGIAVVVHPSCKIDSLTLEQVRDIFSGKIKDFAALGGDKTEISLYGRENSSGTYEFFKEHVLGKDTKGNPVEYASSTQVLQGTAALAEAVAKDPKGIAYGGVGYFAHRTDVKILKIKKDAKTPGVWPAHDGKVIYENIWEGSYSISRGLFMFNLAKGNKAVDDFMKYIESPEGQEVVKQMEYIPLPASK